MTVTLREKLMHYTHDLDCGADLKQEAIATIEHIAQYMDEDELLHHSRPLALAYLALTEDASVPVVYGRWISWEEAGNFVPSPDRHECSVCHDAAQVLVNGFELLSDYCPNCGAKMDGGADHDE